MEQLTYESVLNLIYQQSTIFSAQLAAQSKDFSAQLAAQSRDFSAKMEEMRNSHIQLEKSLVQLEKRVSQTNKTVADFTNSYGEAVEESVRMHAKNLFRKRGIILNETLPRIVKEDNADRKLYEIDLLLVNTTCAVVVEVKHKFKPDDVDNHLLRLEKIKKNPISSVKGKILYGAISATIIHSEVEKMAMKNGLFVIKHHHKHLSIVNSLNFKPKEWTIF